MSIAATGLPRLDRILWWVVDYVEGFQKHGFRLLTCRALHMTGDSDRVG